MKTFLVSILLLISTSFAWISGHPLNRDIALQQVKVWTEVALCENTEDETLKTYARGKVVQAKSKLLYLQGKKLGFIQ